MTYANDRLDRIERILENLAERQDRFQTEMDANHEYIGSEIGALTRNVASLQQQVSEVTSRVDEGFRQAERDRALTSQLIERLIEVLTERFTSNGHSE